MWAKSMIVVKKMRMDIIRKLMDCIKYVLGVIEIWEEGLTKDIL